MATGRSTQLTRQIGEHLVAAELGRRGLTAAPFAGNVPLYDLLAADDQGRAVPIQVKAINGPSWQFTDVRKFLDVEMIGRVQHVRGKLRLPNPNLICVFVFIREDRNDEFYVFRLGDLQDHFLRNYRGGERPRNPNSFHTAIWPKELQQHRDKWDLVIESLAASNSNDTLATKGSRRRPTPRR